ncbi:hypothetical protein [Ensifer adhaerens]
MVTEVSSVGFCDSLPEDIRATVDTMAPQFLAESWPVRFVALMSMLEDITTQVGADDHPFVVNNWVIIVSGLLERLPRDLSSPECLALMRHSVVAQFQRQAIRIAPDVDQQNEHLRGQYPQWSLVEDLLHEYETWAVRQSRMLRH